MTQTNLPMLALSRDLIQTLLRRAGPTDQEICGFIAANPARTIFWHYGMTNQAPDPKAHFDMDPQAQLSVLRDIQRREHQLLAIYHSHPAASAWPSQADIKGHGHPDKAAVILSRQDSDNPVRAWQLRYGQATPWSINYLPAPWYDGFV